MKLKIDYRAFNSGGKGGQHSNRTFNAIEASVQLPDGALIKTTAQTSKSQKTNRKLARLQLLSLVRKRYKSDKERGEHGERIRNYHAVDNRVKCEASGLVRPYKSVLSDSDAFGEMIAARKDALIREQLKNHTHPYFS